MSNLVNTNILWLPYLKADWKVLRVKNAFYASKEKAHQEKPTILSLARSGVKIRDISNNEGQLAESYYDYNPVRPGDLLLNPMDLYSGANCNVSEVEGVISPAYANLRSKIKLEPKYFDFYFKTQYWTMAMFAHGKGVSFDNRWTLNNETLMNYELPFPPYEEQTKIVELLKDKIAKIDELIQNQEKQIEKLKEINERLDSESFNKIHYSTVTKKMNELAFYKKGPFGSSLKVSMFVPKGENTFKVYEQKNAIYKDENLGYYYIDETKFMQLKSNEVFSGDIIVSCAGTIGECFIMPKNIEKGIINQALMIVRPNDLVDTNFMVLLLEEVFRNYGEQFSNGSAMKNIPPFDVLKNVRVKIPTKKDDQVKFAKELISRNKKIKKLISIKQQKIEKLQEYKKSLIYEYVTGKKEV